MYEKLKSEPALIRLVSRLKNQGKKIVTYNGSFDLLHAGHLRSLKEAKKQGDVLIILLNSDKSVKIYKGPFRPIIPEDERALMLEALSCVDYVTLFDDITPMRILEHIRPDIHCNGSDWGKDCVEREVVERNRGRVHILQWSPGLSTTNLMKRIVELSGKNAPRAVFIDRDGTINNNQEGYIHKKEDFQFAHSAIPALQKLSRTDYNIIIISNQSGVGRGYYTKKDADKLFAWMKKELKKKKIRIDAVYCCPHHPNEKCECRKPKIGLLLKAAKDFGLSLSKSWMVGNEEKDVGAGREANIQTIKIGARLLRTSKIGPHHYAKNLLEAARIIVSNS